MKKIQAIALTSISLLYSIIPTFSTSAQNPESLCYWKTVDGRIISLDSLCIKGSQTLSTLQTSLDLEDVEINIKRSDSSRKYYISGRIRNSTSKTYYNPTFIYHTYVLSEGKLVINQEEGKQIETLSPGETAIFHLTTNHFEVVLFELSQRKLCYAGTVEGTELCKRLATDIRRFKTLYK